MNCLLQRVVLQFARLHAIDFDDNIAGVICNEHLVPLAWFVTLVDEFHGWLGNPASLVAFVDSSSSVIAGIDFDLQTMGLIRRLHVTAEIKTTVARH